MTRNGTPAMLARLLRSGEIEAAAFILRAICARCKTTERLIRLRSAGRGTREVWLFASNEELRIQAAQEEWRGAVWTDYPESESGASPAAQRAADLLSWADAG